MIISPFIYHTYFYAFHLEYSLYPAEEDVSGVIFQVRRRRYDLGHGSYAGIWLSLRKQVPFVLERPGLTEPGVYKKLLYKEGSYSGSSLEVLTCSTRRKTSAIAVSQGFSAEVCEASISSSRER